MSPYILKRASAGNPDLPTHHILYMIAHQIDHLGLSKKSLKSLITRAKKALTDDKKIEIINELNAQASMIWRKFLNAQIDKPQAGKTAAAEPEVPVLSNYLLAILLFQINAYGLSRSPVKTLMQKARKALQPAARLAITRELNDISEIVYRAFRVKFRDSDEEELQEKMDAAVPDTPVDEATPPAKKRVKKVVEKIVKKQDAKVEDLATVQKAIIETPSASDPSLAMLRERAEVLKVDISDLGRKKKEILKRLELAEAGALPKDVPVIPVEVKSDESLAPEPDKKPTSKAKARDFEKFVARDFSKEKGLLEMERLQKDFDATLAKNLPRGKKFKVELRYSGDYVSVYQPQNLPNGIGEDQAMRIAESALEEMGITRGYTGGGTSREGNFRTFPISKEIISQYGRVSSVDEDLSELPEPRSISDLERAREKLNTALRVMINKYHTKANAESADYRAEIDKVKEWAQSVTDNIMGTTVEQYAKSLVELAERRDRNYTLSLDARSGAWTLKAGGTEIDADWAPFDSVINPKGIGKFDMRTLVPKSKHNYPQGQAVFESEQKVEKVAELAQSAVEGLLGVKDSGLLGYKRGRSWISVSSKMKWTENGKVFLAVRLREVVDLVRKTLKDNGIVVESVGTVMSVEQEGSRPQGINALLEKANSDSKLIQMNGGQPFTRADLFRAEINESPRVWYKKP